MSGFSQIRPYFRSKLKELGFREWVEAFNYENIPSTILDRGFHIDTPTGGRRGPYDQNSQEIEHDCIVRVFFKGHRNPSAAVDVAMASYGDILRSCLSSDRLGLGVKNIYLADVNLRPYAPSNDNLVLLEITFTCLIEICT